VQQAGAEPVFHRGEIAADHGCRHVQVLGGLGEAGPIGHFHEYAYCGQAIHFIDPCNKQSTDVNFINQTAKHKVRSASIPCPLKEITMFSLKRSPASFPALTLGVVASDRRQRAEPRPLSVKVYNADANSFHVNAVVVSGKSEAIVIDSGFTRADALRVAANVLDSGKTLKTIFISNADPDFYFGAEVLKNLFPQAQVLTTPAVREKIEAKLAGKLAFWAPKMGANAPQQPIVPDLLQGHHAERRWRNHRSARHHG
jgi:hypothetical protein